MGKRADTKRTRPEETWEGRENAKRADEEEEEDDEEEEEEEEEGEAQEDWRRVKHVSRTWCAKEGAEEATRWHHTAYAR